jgi:deaminated glutathione amidase
MSAARPFRAGLVQLRTGTDMAANAEAVCASVREACALGAEFVVTPEMTNIIEARRDALLGKVTEEARTRWSRRCANWRWRRPSTF